MHDAVELSVLPTHAPGLFQDAVERAACALERGEVVVLPTETVYGLAANALDPAAVASIYRIKGRPAHNPIIVHVSSLEMARRCVAGWTETATRLAAEFWPGPLTLVLAKSGIIPAIITAGGDTVAVRFPSHPFMRAVIERCGFPIAAPSANLSNEISPTTAEHCRRSLEGRVRLIVDGGPCQVGIESTVVDLVSPVPRVLRPGMIAAEAILQVVGGESGGRGSTDLALGGERPDHTGGHGGAPLRSPGLLTRHYSPKARLMVWSWADEKELRRRMEDLDPGLKPVHVIAHDRIPLGLDPAQVAVVPSDPEAFARALYAEWHRCDEAGAGSIIVEAVPAGGSWDGIRDRLRRASSGV